MKRNTLARAAAGGGRLRRLIGIGLVSTTLLMGVELAIAQPASALPCRTNCGDPADDPLPVDKPSRPGGYEPLYVALGDSFGSGEGAPDAMLPWTNEKCHRSALSAPIRAAKRLAQHNQFAGNILYTSYACSGATLNQGPKLDGTPRDGGILTGQTSSGQPSQISQINARYGSRKIDALSISIGGNDLSYADILKDCSFGNCVPWDSPTRKMFDWDAPRLQASLRDLITAIQGDANGNGRTLAGNASYVYLTAYPDLFNDANAVTCNSTGGAFVEGFTTAENGVMRGYLQQLNTFLARAVTEANARPTAGHKPVWKLIAAPDFTRNGYCAATKRYINNLEMSLVAQQDASGTMHPNAAGHQEWSNQLYNVLSWIATSAG
ncbi:SGNH/GDSL hydrolase family protein [Actinoplanes regularis]|uniref:GDSL-like Lipase/Acylhydrolase family protein n=1 Tax=Actinoplanes regularis TaxID=52697 RepID=A0A239A6M4_9ACTN|nr:SGNH/GDSL hydrolase family protein [Actinoplanes regularis]GIE87098.1 hypothetical protein Are01nite_35780 [Actinoplanes regularis]SNR90543.1 GDSL-like Lipase/Acylhydrolase family protein [Actinoplanes regularis]